MKGRKKRKAVPKVWCDQCGDWHSVACPTPGEIEAGTVAIQGEWSPRLEAAHRTGGCEAKVEPTTVSFMDIHGNRRYRDRSRSRRDDVS